MEKRSTSEVGFSRLFCFHKDQCKIDFGNWFWCVRIIFLTDLWLHHTSKPMRLSMRGTSPSGCWWPARICQCPHGANWRRAVHSCSFALTSSECWCVPKNMTKVERSLRRLFAFEWISNAHPKHSFGVITIQAFCFHSMSRSPNTPKLTKHSPLTRFIRTYPMREAFTECRKCRKHLRDNVNNFCRHPSTIFVCHRFTY